MKKKHMVILYIISALTMIIVMLVTLLAYESDYGNGQRMGDWYSRESMTWLELIAYQLTYILSFPTGTLMGLFDHRYLSHQWLLIVWPHLIGYFFLADFVFKKMAKTTRRNKNIDEPETE